MNTGSNISCAKGSSGLFVWRAPREPLPQTFYKGNTTFIITTDHGRGTKPLDTWRDHGKDIDGADEVWVIAFGKGVRPMGEIKVQEQLYSNQIAASIAELLNIEVDKDSIGLKFKFIAN